MQIIISAKDKYWELEWKVVHNKHLIHDEVGNAVAVAVSFCQATKKTMSSL